MIVKQFTLNSIAEFLTQYAEKSTDVYWLSSQDFQRIIYVSPAYEKIWGRKIDELYANPSDWRDALVGKDASYNPIADMAQRVAIEGSNARYDELYQIRRPDGEIRWILDHGFPIYDANGTCCGVTGVATNITEQKKIEQKLLEAKERAESANEAKEAFLKNMRHDLRTPFSGIFSLSEWMYEHETDPKKKYDLSCISQSAKILLDYMNTVLEQAQLGRKLSELVVEEVDLKGLLEESLTIIRPAAISKSLSLGLEYPQDIPYKIQSDRSSIQRIIINLLGNAIKFTPTGSINIAVKCVEKVANSMTLSICVIDTGIGIPIDKREEIFEKFTRLEPAYKGNYSGMGLGLHDVKVLCEQLKGRVSVSSNGEQGSIFTCTFTFKCADIPSVGATSASTSVEPKPSGGRKRILLVEDQPIAAYVASQFLTSAHYDVDVASTGAMALDKFTSQGYSAVLLDIGLPDMTGIMLAEHLRKLDRANAQPLTPLIALTAHETLSEAERSVFDEVLHKPITPMSLETLSGFILE